MRRVVIFTLLVISTIAVAFLAYEFRRAAFLLLFALIISSALRPPILRLSHKIPKGLAILLVYIAFVAAIIGLLILITPGILTEFGKIINDLALVYDQIWQTWPSGTNLEKLLIQQLPPPDTFLSSITGDQVVNLVSAIAGITASSLTALGEFAIVIVLSVYWSIYRNEFERFWLSRLNHPGRQTVRIVWHSIESTIGAYIRSELLQSLLAGCLLYFTFWLFQLPYPLLLAVLGAVAWLIPYIGVIIALSAVFMIGLMVNLATAVLTTTITLVVYIALQILVEPLLFRRKDFSALLTVLMMILLADSFGLLGLLIAPPVAAAIQIVLRATLAKKPERNEPLPTIQELKARLAAVQEKIAQSKDSESASLIPIVKKLEPYLDTLEKKQGISR